MSNTKKKIEVYNPSELPTASFHEFKLVQGDLKTLSDENKAKLKNSILKYGFRFPFFVWISPDGAKWINDGHQREKVLAELEADSYAIPPLPYVLVEAKDKKEAAELLLQANSRYGEYNPDTTFFADFDINLSFLNDIEIPELDILLKPSAPEIVEDEPSEPPMEPLTKRGEIWLCGRHRVMCGDATSKEDVEMLMGSKKIDMLLTDPPYGVSYADKNAFLNAISRGNHIQVPIEGDHNTVAEMKTLWTTALKNAYDIAKDGAVYYVCGPQGGELMMMMMISLVESGWGLRHMLIWVKNNHVLGRSDYHYKHEPLLYGWREGAAHAFYGGTGSVSVFEVDKPHKSDLHPVMKPIELLVMPIRNSSKAGDIILDPFGGSGSTLIACEQTNRICYMMEIAPHYVDVILDRYANFTHDGPIRESDGMKWSKLK